MCGGRERKEEEEEEGECTCILIEGEGGRYIRDTRCDLVAYDL